jgi:FkbM family methyltransferase
VIDGCKIDIPTDLFSFNVIEEFVSGNYELQERKLITKYVNSSDRVLELGGGVGAVSCMLNKKLADQSKHLVIEANPDLIPILEHNGINNNCRFKTLNCIPIKSSNGKFYLNRNAWAGSNVRKSKKYIDVPVESWEEIEKEIELKPTAVVMDIEGGEVEFIKENEDLISNLRLIIVEFHPFTLGFKKVKSCQAILGRFGLTRVDRIGNVEVWRRKN